MCLIGRNNLSDDVENVTKSGHCTVLDLLNHLKLVPQREERYTNFKFTFLLTITVNTRMKMEAFFTKENLQAFIDASRAVISK